MNYINKNHIYTNPAAYDTRKETGIEAYLESLWSPILKKYASQYISDTTTVCDFGCGTLAHAKLMKDAKKVYAIDSNNEMIKYGINRQKKYISHTIPLIESALKTSLPSTICNIIWSIGLTEYVNLDKLLYEMSRVATPTSTILLQFPNAYHPLHTAIRIISTITGTSTKNYRTLHEVRDTAAIYGWRVTQVESVGFYFPIPSSLMRLFVPLWRGVDMIMRPFTPLFPIGNNVWCVLQKSTSAEQ